MSDGARETIGLVGGLGVGATIHYYQKLAAELAGRSPSPGLVISHAELPRVFALTRANALDDLAAYLNGHLRRLADAGATFATIGAVMPHICAPQLKAIAALPMLDLIDCIAAELHRRRLRKVAILGTQFVMESDLYGRLTGVEIIRPSPDALAFVHETYMAIARAGSVDGADIGGVRKIAQTLTAAGAEAILLAGTELSLAFNEETAGFPAIDCARVHVAAIVERAAAP